MSKCKVKSEFENGVESFFAAAEAVRQAQQNFDNAFPEYFEIANKELTLAKEHFDVIGKKVKLLSMPVQLSWESISLTRMGSAVRTR